MSKYTLTQEDEFGRKVIHKFEEECLNDVLRHIKYFLNGCSFVFDMNDELRIINESFEDGLSKSKPSRKGGKKK